ncbi:MAG: hypothetical protein HY721_07805 [Planctomycetes bacterium]|nr:hypothetical protein [Planctomycetota bacterium]
MVPEPDYEGMVERLERLAGVRGSPYSFDLSSVDFAAGCSYLQARGLSIQEIAEVFAVDPERVRDALRPRARGRWLAAAAAALILLAAGFLGFTALGGPGLEVELVPERLRSPQALPVGSAFSLKLQRLRSPSTVRVIRIDPDLTVAAAFPRDASQALRRFREGDLVPGDSGGRSLELAAGSSPGEVTLLVAVGGPVADTPEEAEALLAESVQAARAGGDPVAERHRLARAVAHELRRRGAEDVAVLTFQVTE